MTLAELKRRIKPGVELTLVNNPKGPCRIRRTVVKAQGNAMACSGHGDPGDGLNKAKPGALSWMWWPKASGLEGTEKGFRIYDPHDRGFFVEYEWGHNVAEEEN
jgi:hypothetical protein